MFGIFDFSHSDGRVVIFHCSFSSLIANNVIRDHLLIFSFELPVQVLPIFVNMVFVSISCLFVADL